MTDGPHHHRQPFLWMQAVDLQRLFDIYDDAGHELRPVGGCVRDSLLGQMPADIDMASDCPPEKGMEILKEAGVKVIPTGLQHGTITAVIDHKPYEITCLRHDVENHGRHATVAWTRDWQGDAARRDFTVNALYMDRHGGLYDWFGGLGDLEAGCLRFVGDAATRIEEDFLRILRFYRFSARYAGRLDSDGHQACIALRDGLNAISVERIWSEIRKMLLARNAGPVVAAMAKDGVLSVALQGWNKPVQAFDHLPSDAILRLAALLGPGDDAISLATHLKMAKDDAVQLSGLSNRAYHQRLENCQDGQALRHFAWDTSADLVSGLMYLAGRKKEECAAMKSWARPVFPIRGKDLITLGIAPGPEMGQVMQRLQQIWIASDFSLLHDDLMIELD